MARTVAELPAGSRITDFITLGVLTKTFHLTKIHWALAATEKASVRQRDLPAHVVIYNMMGLALYRQSSYREVLRRLLEGIEWLLHPSATLRVAGMSGISQDRTRLGCGPLRQLPDEIVQPIARKATKGAWFKHWHRVSLDGSTLDVADAPENNQAFGRPGRQSWPERLSADPLRLAGGKRDAHLVWQPDGGLPQQGSCARQKGAPPFAEWHVVFGRPLLFWVRKHRHRACETPLPDGS
jgi:hypothetical protein